MNILKLLLKNVEAYVFCFSIFEHIQSPSLKQMFPSLQKYVDI